MSKIKIGILAVQGDVTENFLATMASMSELGIDGSVIQVKTVEQISTLDGLIIPGGESTVIGQMSLVNGAIKKIKFKGNFVFETNRGNNPIQTMIYNKEYILKIIG